MSQLDRLRTVAPRSVWQNEARDFTPWLLANADALADALGIDIELTAAEHPVGGYSLDLVGRDLTNDCILIAENQLEVTDHSHLGQLLTYAAGTDAQTVVWLATAFREEHRQALDFLNDIGGEKVRFFGVEVGVVQIGDSVPAPLFKLRAQPNDWHAQIATQAQAASRNSGKSLLYQEFWSRFLERQRVEKPQWTRTAKPPASNWLPTASPFKGGPIYSYSFARDGRMRVELYIDYGDADRNEHLFKLLEDDKDRIEQDFNGKLEWEAIPDKRASRVAAYGVGDVARVEEHERYVDWFFEVGERFRNCIAAAAGRLGSEPSERL